MSVNFKPRTLLFAFMNGSYKKIVAQEYDHKEWIVVTRPDGTKSFINSKNVKWIDEMQPEDKVGPGLNKQYIATEKTLDCAKAYRQE